ncbi:MAG TPA: serine O-acetyltransferase EpsC [Segetibacter sp.]
MEKSKYQLLIDKMLQNNNKRVQTFPSKEKIEKFVTNLKEFLFIDDIASNIDSIHLEKRMVNLEEEFEQLVNTIMKNNEQTRLHTRQLMQALPFIYDQLLDDAEAILASDPAARSLQEIMIAYPGFYATVVYRISNQLFMQGLHTLARFFSEYAHSKTGIDIHPGATIGHAFAIDHGTGIVIGETTYIGNNVKLYQGVTLGALNVVKGNAALKRHPTVEDNAVIYAGATILGGETIIGKGSIIGGNVWLTYSVPSNSVVYHKSEIHIKDNNPFPEPLNFVI